MPLSRRSFVAAPFLLAGCLFASGNAQAQEADWPKRPIRFYVSTTAGSSGDVICRIVADQLSRRLGVSVVIVNQPTAGGTLAASTLARSQPDGYTIGMITTSTHVVSKIFDPSLPFDPVKDFAPVSMLGSSPYALVVTPSLPVKTVSELVAYAKKIRPPLGAGTYGTNTLGYLVGLRFAQQADIDVNQVPYRSSAEAVLDVMQGRVEMQFSTLPPAIPLINDNKLRPLATTGAKRVARLPDVPTLAESGFPDFDVALWIGVAAAAGTPPAIVARLNREISEILQTPQSQKAFAVQDFIPEPAPSSYLADRISGDVARWREVVEKARKKS